MTLPNARPTPDVWTEAELEIQAQIALDEFVDRRLAEPGGKYVAHIKKLRRSIVDLFQALAGVDPGQAWARRCAGHLTLMTVYTMRCGTSTAPPVSDDDLGVLVTRKIAGSNKTLIKSSDDLVVDILKLICKLADPYRFPWIVTLADTEPRRAASCHSIDHGTSCRSSPSDRTAWAWQGCRRAGCNCA